MAELSTQQFRALEGHRVGLALVDGSRIEDCLLVCAPRHGLSTVWVLLPDGADAFVPLGAVTEVWETPVGEASKADAGRAA